MSCGIEFGKCDICGKDDYLERTYFEYDIKCGCHSPRHFELVHHCKDCIPSMPTEIHPYIKAMDGKSYKTTITNILPIEIFGEFIITEPIIKEKIMTREEIDILLKDLCARLPYGVKCSFGVNDAVYEITGINPTCCGASEIQATHIKSEINGDFALNCCKPYLFPLSSMTEEQKEEYDYECNKDLKALSHSVVNRTYTKTRIATPLYYGIDWLNKNHFDYRGLIPMGLANDATELNIY